MASKKERKKYEDDKELSELANRLKRKKNDLKWKADKYQWDVKCIEAILYFLSKGKKTICGFSIKEIIDDYLNWDDMALAIVYDALNYSN